MNSLRFISALTALTIAIPPLCASAQTTEPAKGNKQTVFIYMINTDLTEAMQHDIKEMLDSEAANVLIIKGTEDENVSISRLTQNGLYEIKDSANYNMYDSDDIYDMMFRYMARYKADKYSVFFWDHGGGFTGGYGMDPSGENKALTPIELAKVFKDIKHDAQEDFGISYNLETIGFDACLMSDLQTQNEFAKAGFKYFIGSEEVENAFGWDYSFLNMLNENPAASGYELGKGIIDCSSAAYKEQNIKRPYTLACTELSKTAAVYTAVENLAAQLSDAETAVHARINSEVFGNSDDYADLKSYAKSLADYNIDTAELQDALNEAVVYYSSDIENTCGISLYGYNGSNNKSYEVWQSLTAGSMPEYSGLQQRIKRSHTPVSSSPLSISINANNGIYSMDIPDDIENNIYDAQFAVYKRENGSYRRVVQSYDAAICNGTVSVSYNNIKAELLSDDTAYPCELKIKDGEYYIHIAKDTGTAGAAADMKKMKINLTHNGEISAVAGSEPEALSGRDDSSLATGDRIYTLNSIYNEDFTDAAQIPDIFPVHNPKFCLSELSGDYVCRFEFTNAYSYVQYCSELTPLSAPDTVPSHKDAHKFMPDGSVINIGADEIPLPCDIKRLTKMGYTADTDPVRLAASEVCGATLHKGDTYIDITIKNFSGNMQSSDKCTVTAISSSDASYGGIECGMRLDGSGAAMVYTTSDAIKYIYAVNDASELPCLKGDSGLNGLYLNSCHDYAAVETDRADGTIRRITLNSEQGCVVTYEKASTAKYDYNAPQNLGYDPYSFNIRLDGTIYALPVPVSVLTADSWEMTELISLIPSRNAREVTFTRNGKSFTADIVNYSDTVVTADNALVCGIYIEDKTLDAAIPGNISLNNAMKELSDGNTAYVTDSANKFMAMTDRLVYTEGDVTDSSGEISIYPDAVYIYHRLYGIRSVDGYDVPLKYFIY